MCLKRGIKVPTFVFSGLGCLEGWDFYADGETVDQALLTLEPLTSDDLSPGKLAPEPVNQDEFEEELQGWY
jgi:hypothetical protein